MVLVFFNIIQPWQEKEILPEWGLSIYLLVYLQAKQKNIIKDSDRLLWNGLNVTEQLPRWIMSEGGKTAEVNGDLYVHAGKIFALQPNW